MVEWIAYYPIGTYSEMFHCLTHQMQPRLFPRVLFPTPVSPSKTTLGRGGSPSGPGQHPVGYSCIDRKSSQLINIYANVFGGPEMILKVFMKKKKRFSKSASIPNIPRPPTHTHTQMINIIFFILLLFASVSPLFILFRLSMSCLRSWYRHGQKGDLKSLLLTLT